MRIIKGKLSFQNNKGRKCSECVHFARCKALWPDDIKPNSQACISDKEHTFGFMEKTT